MPVLFNLEHLCDIYSWETEEAGGRKPLLKSRESLKYYAVLMSSWMSSKPLKWMIVDSINHYKKRGEIWRENERETITFDPKNQKHINIIINNLITDIDNKLRFKLKNYFSNYYEILADKLGEKNAGENWGEFLEYGTNDRRIIELQNIGIPRHLANYLLENYKDFFEFEHGALMHVKKNSLIEAMDVNSPEFKELQEVI